MSSVHFPDLRSRLASLTDPPQQPLSQAIAPARGAFLGAGLMSGLINLLYLTGSFFMLEVYDRVIPSHSVPTLIALGAIAFVLYLFQGLLDLVRGRIFVRIGALLEKRLSGRAFEAIVHLAVSQHRIDPQQPVRDLDQVRGFLWSGGPVAFLDLPWMPIYLFICFLFHPLIGATAIAGAALLVCVTFFTERGAQSAAKAAIAHGNRRSQIGEATRRNAEVIRALGMTEQLCGQWQISNGGYLGASSRASDVVLGFGALSKVLRTALQSFVLALGAWLVINQEASGGIMIASSILVSRALAPIEMVISQWKGFVGARLAWRRLEEVLRAVPDEQRMHLPAPSKSFAVEGVTLAPPASQTPNVFDVSFALEAGSALGVIGASASGKSSLARALVGLWKPLKGAVRLDGAALDQWSAGRLGRHVGYMPQDVELFDGTVAQNIARFDPQASPEAVVAAAKAADIHKMILDLPGGYDTPIGEQGSFLSAGQKQRVALARALYGNPFLVVLDEPNSNLDADGDAALNQAILSVRARGGILVIIAHRPSAIAACNLLMLMAGGRCQMFGAKDEVLAAVTRPAVQRPLHTAARAQQG